MSGILFFNFASCEPLRKTLTPPPTPQNTPPSNPSIPTYRHTKTEQDKTRGPDKKGQDKARPDSHPFNPHFLPIYTKYIKTSTCGNT